MQARLFLIAYDISSPKRWRRAQKQLRKLCQREQLSVFACRGTASRMKKLEQQLGRTLHPPEARLMVLVLGPADTAAERLKTVNPLSTMADLEAMVL